MLKPVLLMTVRQSIVFRPITGKVPVAEVVTGEVAGLVIVVVVVVEEVVPGVTKPVAPATPVGLVGNVKGVGEVEVNEVVVGGVVLTIGVVVVVSVGTGVDTDAKGVVVTVGTKITPGTAVPDIVVPPLPTAVVPPVDTAVVPGTKAVVLLEVNVPEGFGVVVVIINPLPVPAVPEPELLNDPAGLVSPVPAVPVPLLDVVVIVVLVVTVCPGARDAATADIGEHCETFHTKPF